MHGLPSHFEVPGSIGPSAIFLRIRITPGVITLNAFSNSEKCFSTKEVTTRALALEERPELGDVREIWTFVLQSYEGSIGNAGGGQVCL